MVINAHYSATQEKDQISLKRRRWLNISQISRALNISHFVGEVIDGKSNIESFFFCKIKKKLKVGIVYIIIGFFLGLDKQIR